MSLDQTVDVHSIDESLITCQICYEVFNHHSRIPKLLPCGHNFCETCIFSLCVHQEFYLLDSIKCPVCREEYSTKKAKQAPTNFGLCRVLEDSCRRKDQNITMIEVQEPDYLPPPMKLATSSMRSRQHQHQPRHHHHVSKKVKSLAKRTEENKHLRCADCQRKISLKSLFRTSRYCVDCTSTSRMTIICLECCVNSHNGHELLTESALHQNQQKTLQDLRVIRKKVVEFSSTFDERTDEIRDSGLDVCVSLLTEKQNLLNYTLASLDDVLRRIEHSPILFPPVLRTIQDEQHHNYSNLLKLSVDLEKSLICRKNTKPTSLTFIENMMNQTSESFSVQKGRGLRNLNLDTSVLSMRQSRVSLREDDSLFHESINALVKLMSKHPMCLQLEFHHSSVSSKDTVEERKSKIMSCAHATTCMLEDVQVSMIPLFADVLLNCFYQLNKLSKNKFMKGAMLRRADIWRQAATSYSVIFGITAKFYPAFHPERVDILDDLAYLCHLYSDVADQNTITLCHVESTRAANSDMSGLTDIEHQRTVERLELIDEHLTECRRQQKLLELRKSSKVSKSSGKFKKLFGGCFRAQNQEEIAF